MGLPAALSSERADGHFSGGRERARAVVAATRHARTGPGRLTEKQIIAFCLSPDLAMVFNTKKIERELKIQKASKFFVNCKRREKKYKKTTAPASWGVLPEPVREAAGVVCS